MYNLGMRPPSDLLDTISKLAELDAETRKGAVRNLAERQQDLADAEINTYVFERLISGCSSARAAVRLGYTTALGTILTSKAGELWNLDKVLAVANKKMDLAEKTVGTGHAIGQFLVLAAYAQSKNLKEAEVFEIVEQSKKIRDAAPSLAFSQINLLCSLAVKAKESVFQKSIAPTVEMYLEGLNSQYTPENVYLALRLRISHSNTVAKYAKFVKKDGSCQFSDDQYPKILAALKRCDYATLQVFLPILIKTSIESACFEKMYLKVLEPWALSSNETKVFDRILSIVNHYFEFGGDAKLIVVVFTKEVLNRMETATRGKGQFRLMSKKVEDFTDCIKSKLSDLRDEDAYETLKALEKSGNVDKACGTGLTTALLSNLGKKQISAWIKDNLSNQDEVRKIVTAFSNWNEASRITVLTALLAQKATETSQSVVASIVDSLFYVKTRAGEFASIQISDKNEQILRQLVVAVQGEEEVKKAEKSIGKASLRKKSLLILWYVTRLWSRIAANSDDSSAYDSDSSEILAIAKNESDDNNALVFVDLLLSILSREQKFHRTPTAFAFVHAIPSLKSKDLYHIIETAMMSEAELAGNEAEDMEDEEGMPFDESEIPTRSEEDDDSDFDEEEEEEEDDEENEAVDQELLDKLNIALGDAAPRESSSDVEMDDLDDEEMQKMDERLAAAFKAIAPKATKSQKRNAKNVEALKMKIADLLLIGISSKELSEQNKVKLVVPLLKWAKLDAKTHDKVAQKALELVNIIIKMKFTEVSEKDALQLMKEVLEEAQTTTNILIVDVVARCVTFVLKISSKDGKTMSSGVRKEFQLLFDNYLKNVEGKVPSNFVIQPIADLPLLFIDQLGMLIDAGFDEQNRIFKRTEILGATALIFSKQVLQETKIKSAIIKKIGKLSAAYFQNVIDSDKSELKPRLFGTILQLVLKVTSCVQTDEQHLNILRESLESVIQKMSEGEVFVHLKKINPTCHHIIGKSINGAFSSIKKNLEIEN
uniref:DNA polymerase V n=1 Tax=Caenorhabditis tropicalis TaxID=1561998 RepID=A0A1I7U3D8_9PELO